MSRVEKKEVYFVGDVCFESYKSAQKYHSVLKTTEKDVKNILKARSCIRKAFDSLDSNFNHNPLLVALDNVLTALGKFEEKDTEEITLALLDKHWAERNSND
jgi:hypothetical protein